MTLSDILRQREIPTARIKELVKKRREFSFGINTPGLSNRISILPTAVQRDIVQSWFGVSFQANRVLREMEREYPGFYVLLVHHAKRYSFAKGAMLAAPGTYVDAMYLILDGNVQVRDGEDETIISSNNVGHVGECLFSPARRNDALAQYKVHVRASSHCAVLAISSGLPRYLEMFHVSMPKSFLGLLNVERRASWYDTTAAHDRTVDDIPDALRGLMRRSAHGDAALRK